MQHERGPFSGSMEVHCVPVLSNVMHLSHFLQYLLFEWQMQVLCVKACGVERVHSSLCSVASSFSLEPQLGPYFPIYTWSDGMFLCCSEHTLNLGV